MRSLPDDEEEEEASNAAVTKLEFEPLPSFFIGFSLVVPLLVAGEEEPAHQVHQIQVRTSQVKAGKVDQLH